MGHVWDKLEELMDDAKFRRTLYHVNSSDDHMLWSHLTKIPKMDNNERISLAHGSGKRLCELLDKVWYEFATEWEGSPKKMNIAAGIKKGGSLWRLVNFINKPTYFSSTSIKYLDHLEEALLPLEKAAVESGALPKLKKE